MPTVDVQPALHAAEQLRHSGRLSEAIEIYDKILSQDPRHFSALFSLAQAFEALGDWQKAIDAYASTVQVNPQDVPARLSLGAALLNTGRPNEALPHFAAVINQDPSMVQAHVNLGIALDRLNRLDEAIASFRRGIALAPQLAAAHFNLAVTLRRAGKIDEAADAYRNVLSLDPKFVPALINLGVIFQDRAEIDVAIECFQSAISAAPRSLIAHSNYLYAMHFQPGRTAREIYLRHRAFNDQFCTGLARDRSIFDNDRDPNRRLRIGYVSPDFRHHPVARFLLPLLKHRDRSAIEVFCYSDVQSPDAYTEQIRSNADAWRDIRGQSYEQVDTLIRADRIDILVDLCAFMQDHRMLLFARRPAPVQATYLAYCSTTGLDAIDYRISDPYLEPAACDERCYSEKTLRLPESYWCYEPYAHAPEVAAPPSSSAGHVTFGCLNGFIKVSTPALETWCEILRAVPHSKLLLHAHDGSHRQRMSEFLAARNIEPSRLGFVPFLPVSQFLATHHQVDIGLDPFPYGGGTTTCDALWMGVPIVSLIGQTAVGRGGLSILSNIGLPDLVAKDPQQYVQIAADLASDTARLSRLRFSMRERIRSSPLMDAKGAARNFESLYRTMWQSWINHHGGSREHQNVSR